MLIVILSALALCASIIRFVAQMQLFGSAGLPFEARRIVLMEAGNWAAWTVWATMLVWVIDRSEDTARPSVRRTPLLIALTLVPIVLVPVLVSPVHLFAMDGRTMFTSMLHVAGHNLPTNALLGAVMLGVALLQTAQRRTRRLELTAADLRTQLAESQLATLRTQMDPHFLFNSLNGIAVLARRGESTAVERMVTGLSALLRHSLDSASQQLIPLRSEIDVLRSYLDVEAARFGNRLSVSWKIADETRECLVPSFLLQPIVENAIRHGFRDGSQPLHVEIAAGVCDSSLHLVVSDDGVGVLDRESVVEGIGLGNTRARLTALFGDKAALTLLPREDRGGVRVVITLPASPNTALRT